MVRSSKNRKLLYNCDCNDYLSMIGEHPAPEDYENAVLSPLEGTQADTFLLNLGIGNVAEYESSALGFIGEYNDFNFKNINFYKSFANARHLMENGNDPLDILINGCRKRKLDVFCSYRVNDVHDLWPSCVDLKPVFKREHPEWCHKAGVHQQFGNQPCDTALDWRRKEVRDLKYQAVAELIDNHDFDGLELDFLRDLVYFEPNKGMSDSYCMTDWIRKVRNHLDKVSEERGKYIELAVRVPMTVQGCISSGFDLGKFANDKLVDIVIGGTGGNDGMYMDTLRFKEIFENTGVKFFTCLNGFYETEDMHKFFTPERVLFGVADQLWADGPDGIYTFNLYPDFTGRMNVLRHIASVETLKGLNKTYIVDSAGNRFAKNLPIILGETESEYLMLPIKIGDDLGCYDNIDKLQLKIFIENLTDSDEIEFVFNSHILDKPQKEVIDRHTCKYYCVWNLRQEWIANGNSIMIKLNKRNDHLSKYCPLVLKQIHMDLDFKG